MNKKNIIHTDSMLDFQAIEKPTMDQIDLISSLLLHKEYAKEDVQIEGRKPDLGEIDEDASEL